MSAVNGDLMPSTCPRCGGGFDCGARAGRCDCFDIRLTPEQREAVAQRWQGCLCVACLRDIAGGAGIMAACPSSTASPPAPSS
ncbi:MAG: hypothetical protein DI603_07785 [Roseateles depolymerans]|uniref:Cysteine-rich CWC family protein n=1 Tax=Roseateles depolymerans TaxID=76731 RepID=A0A2W5DNA3_9BURK|nr:MAG: hypothetical protein DI603_07785 [Roseateles depolymerans]